MERPEQTFYPAQYLVNDGWMGGCLERGGWMGGCMGNCGKIMPLFQLPSYQVFLFQREI